MSTAARSAEADAPFPDFVPSDDIITSVRIRRLVAYWQASRKGKRMPARADIDPADIPELLPNIIMLDVEQPFRIRYRLVGTRVAEFNRFDFTGRYLDELHWDSQGRYTRAYRRVIELGVPLFGLDAWPLAGEMTGRSEVVILPLSTDGETVDRCLSMEEFQFSQHQIRRSRIVPD